MQKMAYFNLHLKPGSEVKGKKGRYLLKESIGSGGNGTVFAANVIEERGVPPERGGYAIKVFCGSKNKNDYEKRRFRFQNEIEKVLIFQDKVSNIVPIYDTSINCDEEPDLLWYLMPKASRFNSYRFSFEAKLEYMLRVGESLRMLHDLGYAHRDIKPQNLLFFKGQLFLADFGLVWTATDKDGHITEVNDCLGPLIIRPPEFQSIEDIDGVDYRKSDVYLFAKTLWMVLRNNYGGFSLEYSRSDNHTYIDKADYQIETLEPFHCLMEGATKYNWLDRITLEDCLSYLKDQLRIIRNDLPLERVIAYKYAEETKSIDAKEHPSKKEYAEPSAVVKILNEMSGITRLVFTEPGREFGPLLLKRANHIRGSLFEIEIQNPYNYERRKTIELAIESVCSKSVCSQKERELEFEIQSTTYSFDDNSTREYTQIIEALKSAEKRIRLNARYLMRLVH